MKNSFYHGRLHRFRRALFGKIRENYNTNNDDDSNLIVSLSLLLNLTGIERVDLVILTNFRGYSR